MLGAIIGDVAAWTYNKDKETFYKQLIPDSFEKVELSVYAHAYFRAARRNVLQISEPDICVIESVVEYITEGKLRRIGLWLMWQLMRAWNDDFDDTDWI